MTTQLDAKWELLTQKCGRKAFFSTLFGGLFYTPVRIVYDLGDAALSVNKSKAAKAGMIIGLLGSLFVFFGVLVILNASHEQFEWFFGAVFALIGAFQLSIGLGNTISAAISSRQLRLPLQFKTVIFHDGTMPDISIPSGDLEVRLERKASPAIASTVGALKEMLRGALGGKFHLELAMKDAPDRPLLLATSENREDLLAAFELLAKSFGDSIDTSMSQAKLADGGALAVCPDAIGDESLNARMPNKLVIRSAGLVQIVPSISMKIFVGVSFALSLGLLALLAGLLAKGYSDWVVLLALGAGFFAMSAICVTGWLTYPKIITFDLAGGVMLKKGGKMAVPELATGLSLNRLAALQVCFCGTMESRFGTSPGYELNVVLADEDGKRFTVMKNQYYNPLMLQARLLGEILHLPLIDDSGVRRR